MSSPVVLMTIYNPKLWNMCPQTVFSKIYFLLYGSNRKIISDIKDLSKKYLQKFFSPKFMYKPWKEWKMELKQVTVQIVAKKKTKTEIGYRYTQHRGMGLKWMQNIMRLLDWTNSELPTSLMVLVLPFTHIEQWKEWIYNGRYRNICPKNTSVTPAPNHNDLSFLLSISGEK